MVPFGTIFFLLETNSNTGKIDMTLFDAYYRLYLENYRPIHMSDSRVDFYDWDYLGDVNHI